MPCYQQIAEWEKRIFKMKFDKIFYRWFILSYLQHQRGRRTDIYLKCYCLMPKYYSYMNVYLYFFVICISAYTGKVKMTRNEMTLKIFQIWWFEAYCLDISIKNLYNHHRVYHVQCVLYLPAHNKQIVRSFIH